METVREVTTCPRCRFLVFPWQVTWLLGKIMAGQFRVTLSVCVLVCKWLHGAMSVPNQTDCSCPWGLSWICPGVIQSVHLSVCLSVWQEEKWWVYTGPTAIQATRMQDLVCGVVDIGPGDRWMERQDWTARPVNRDRPADTCECVCVCMHTCRTGSWWLPLRRLICHQLSDRGMRCCPDLLI